MRRFVIVVALSVFVTPPAFAWNKAGHMVTAAIAYQVLKQENDKTIPKVIALLKQHPDFRSWDKQADNLKLAGADRDLYFFMKAARWADDARDNPAFYPPDLHYDRLHYINYPYRPKDEPDGVKTASPDDINILRGYEDKLGVLAGKGQDAERAVALCWIAHLVGDVHQPLHTTSLFSKRFPEGDRGGTLFYIRADDKSTPLTRSNRLMRGSRFITSTQRRSRSRLPTPLSMSFSSARSWSTCSTIRLPFSPRSSAS